MSSERPVRFDLSPPVHPGIGVWPGDAPVQRTVSSTVAEGASVTLSSLHTTVHVGTHADAPSHTVDGGATIDAVALDPYIGPCQVITVAAERGHGVVPGDLPEAVRAPRVLLHTGTFPDPDHFNTDFAACTPELVHHLAGDGVRLVGIDTPSVDLFDSTTLPSHRALVQAGLAHLEGLVLRGVPDGLYELVALPLRLDGFDASPLRAVLRDLPPAQA